MWNDDASQYATVRDAELALLTSDVRRDSARVRELLAPDFVEIGASGRRWLRDDVVTALGDEDRRDEPETSEWLFNELSPEMILVTYRVVTSERTSLRSSIWQLSDDGPVLRFHQGTIAAV